MARILDISTDGFYLSVKRQQLVLQQENVIIATVPIEDLAAIILDNPQIVITQACLNVLLAHNVSVISSDEKHLPLGSFMQLNNHSTQSERMSMQSQLKLTVRKRLWQQLIKQKIELQAKVLEQLGRPDIGLQRLAKKVRSGDPDNIEAQAARRYWSKLFDNVSFRRNRELNDYNIFLNYTYIIARALIARNLAAVGLHPSLGIHHHNKYNNFCLADDLLEPYRPIIDKYIVHKFGIGLTHFELDQKTRQSLLQIFDLEVLIDNNTTSFKVAIQAQCFISCQCDNE